jgi:signal transduction histidine kinase/CheY-like chemotaxis protein
VSSSFFDSLFRHTHYAVFVCDPDGRLVEANPALARVLGFPSLEALLAASDLRLDPIPHPAREASAAIDSGAAAGDLASVTPAPVDGVRWVETRWHRRDGTPISVRMALRTVRDEYGAVLRYEGIAEDITERRRAEELRRRQERLSTIGTTLAGAAHELNNPLAAIMGFAQWLMKKPWPDEDRMALETISHEAERSARIVKDLLTLARRRETERRSPVNLNDVAGYIVGTRRYAMATAGITCELRLDPGLPLVCGDRAQLEQVVLNLVNNAEQALRVRRDAADRDTPPGEPRIAVRTRREGAEVLLEVDDNGPGIAESARSRIWDPFWTTRGEQQGTGLGLSVVHHLVVEHGGSVEVGNSTLPGGGASFRVRLPASADQDASRDPAAAPPAARALDILVLAIDPTDRSFLTRFLTSRGHVVLSTADLERARRYAEQTSFDAVVIDLGLAGSEPAVTDRLRAAPGCRNARVVVTSSAARAGAVPDDSLHARLAGSAIVLAKPFDVALLRRAIEER